MTNLNAVKNGGHVSCQGYHCEAFLKSFLLPVIQVKLVLRSGQIMCIYLCVCGLVHLEEVPTIPQLCVLVWWG